MPAHGRHERCSLISLDKLVILCLELFAQLPGSLQEIDDAVDDVNARMTLIFVHNEHILEDYEKKKKDIERLEEELRELNQFQATANDKIASIHEQWLPELERAVKIIGEKFSNYMVRRVRRRCVPLRTSEQDRVRGRRTYRARRARLRQVGH